MIECRSRFDHATGAQALTAASGIGGLPSATCKPMASSCFTAHVGFLVAVAEREQGIQHVAARRPAPVAPGVTARARVELVAQLEQQPLGGLLADARDLRSSRPLSWCATACCRSETDKPDSTESAVRAPTPLILQQLPKCRALRLGGETKQQMRILAHDQMREQRDLGAGCGRL